MNSNVIELTQLHYSSYQLCNEFDRIFSIFPFLWLSKCFMSSSSILILFVRANVAIAAPELVTYVTWTVLQIATFSIALYLNSKLESKSREICVTLKQMSPFSTAKKQFLEDM